MDPVLLVMNRVRAHLAATGEAVTVDALADVVGVDAEELDALLDEDCRDLVVFPDGTWGHHAPLLDGAVACHVLAEDEVRRGTLDAGNDLVLLQVPDAGYAGPTDHPAGVTYGLGTPGGDWTVPDGLLADAAPGDTVVVTVTGTTWSIDVEEGDTTEVPTEDDVAALLDVTAPLWEGPDLDTFQLYVLVARDAPQVLQRRVPFSALLAAAGIGLWGEWLVPPGIDPDDYGRERALESIERQYPHLPPASVSAALTVRQALRPPWLPGGRDGDPSTAELRAIDAALGDTAATMVTLDGIGDHDGDLDRLARLVEQLEEVVSDPSSGTHVLAAVVAESRGDVDAEVAALEAARRQDNSPIAQLALARIAEDRGDAAGALQHLVRAGFPSDEPIVVDLRRLVETPWPGTGRNEPCPCGSGRKHKRCHDAGTGRELTESERAQWLLARLSDWAQRPAQRPLLARHLGELHWLARTDVLFDNDVLRLGVVLAPALIDAYLGRRGPLLPEADRTVLEAWRAGPGLDVLAMVDGQPQSMVDGTLVPLPEDDVDTLAAAGPDAAHVAVVLPFADVDRALLVTAPVSRASASTVLASVEDSSQPALAAAVDLLLDPTAWL